MRARHTRRRPTSRPAFRSAARAAIEGVERRVMMSAGSLDTSWNGAGLLSIAPPAGTVVVRTVFGVQPDERVVVGQVYVTQGANGSYNVDYTRVSRLTAQGQPDPTFTPVTLGFQGTGVAVEASGKVLVSGASIMESLNADGSIDTSFGGGTGFVSTPFPAGSAIVQGTGDILVSGNTAANVPEVVRYLPTGAVDTSFGSGGTTTLTITGGGAATYTAGPVTTDSSGRVVVGLAVNGNTAVATFATVRLTAAGAFDAAYGVGGVAEVKGYVGPSTTGGIVVAPSGVIYQAGSYNYGSSTGVGYLMAYAPDGQAAYISPQVGIDTFAQSVAVGADSKPVVVGTAVQGTGAGTHTVIAVTRLNSFDYAHPGFSPDTTFNGTGLLTVAYQGPNAQDNTTTGDVGLGGYELPNGNVIVGGYSRNGGTPTTTFNLTKVVGDATLAAGVGTITGISFFDNLRTGTIAGGDPGLANFGAFIDANNNGRFDAGETMVNSTAGGRYTFNGLLPGTYHIVQSLPAGYTHTSPGSAAVASTTVTVAAGGLTTANFGITGTDSISGTFFVDNNANGTFDGGDAAITSGTIYLDLDQSGTLTAADEVYTTGASGTFTFNYLPPTTFVVRAVFPTGVAATTPYPLTVTLVGAASQTGLLIGRHA